MKQLGSYVFGLTLVPAFFLSLAAYADISKQSPYKGEEHRDIKALSENDVTDLLAGKGWGLAKAAELNGVPGPLHLLELREEIALTDEQYLAVVDIQKIMANEAQALGAKIISAERDLDRFFATRQTSVEALNRKVMEIATMFGQLRLVHLSAHLQTIDVLTDKQTESYSFLRGYNLRQTPGKPAGHDHKGH